MVVVLESYYGKEDELDMILTEASNTALFEALITIIVALLASTGFWAFVELRIKRREDSDATRKMQLDLVRGLAHDRIVYLALKYMNRGYITTDEYENICVYLYQPYKKLEGNGTVSRLMGEIDRLPLRKSNLIFETIKKEEDEKE